MNKRLSKELFQRMKDQYSHLYPWPVAEEFTKQDYFKRLIMTVLSQNTSDENTLRAFRQLQENIPVTPQSLAEADVDLIKQSIKTGGLHNVKGPRIQNIAKIVRDEFNGDLNQLMDLPPDETREKLLGIPGVGKKTADVVLTTKHSYQNVIPIDTHMNRIAKRLGLVDRKAGYDETQQELLHFFPDEYREEGSALLWLLAKHTCKSRKPNCRECPLTSLCDYYQKKK